MTLPHNLEAERSVFGAVLIDNDTWGTVAGVLHEKCFYRDAHQRLFRSMQRLADAKAPIDLVSVKNDLEEHGDLQEVGGPAYVASLVDGVPRSTNVDYYAQIVLEKFQAKEVILRCSKTIESAGGADPIADVISQSVSDLVTIGASGMTADLVAGPQLAKEALAFLEDIEERKKTGMAISGFSTGLYDLDHMTDGLQPGTLTVLAARPSQGKTALGLQIALQDGPTAFFSLEMPRRDLVIRAIGTLARVDGWELRRGRLEQKQYARVQTALEIINNGNLAIDDVAGLTPDQIRAKARRWQLRHGLKLIVVDYLTLMRPRQTTRREVNRQEQVNEMTQQLKDTAKELGVPVLALAQLKRPAPGHETREPTLADLRESGAIEQIADLVLFIHRTEGRTVAEEGEAQIIIAKQRNGPQQKLYFWWYPPETRFGPRKEGRP